MTRRKVHEDLGMTIDFTEPGKVVFSMLDYVQRLIDEAPPDLMKGACTSPTSNHPFNANDEYPKLDASTAILYHHLVA